MTVSREGKRMILAALMIESDGDTAFYVQALALVEFSQCSHGQDTQTGSMSEMMGVKSV